MKEIIIDGVEYILTPKGTLQSDEILVPDEIKLSKVGGSIAINNGRHHLYYASGFGNWVVGNNDGDELIKCKLVRYEWEEIKVGDVFYMDDESNPSFDKLNGYAIKLDDENYKYWSKNDCVQWHAEFFYYWKVVQL